VEDALKIVKKPRYGDVDYAWKTRNLDRLFEEPVRAQPKKGKPRNSLFKVNVSQYILCMHTYIFRKFSGLALKNLSH